MHVNAHDERGFTMIMTVIGITLVALVAGVAVVAASGDSHQTAQSANRQQAYEAALAGIHEYAFHLHENQNYWAECTNAATKEKAGGTPIALNEKGSTAYRRPVPGAGGSTYALEIIPAEGHAKCDPTTFATATASMLESLGSARGTFRIRATGYYGSSEVKVMATFKPKSFLDYVYFTQLETSDPVTYGNSELIAAAGRQCSKTIYEGRYTTPLENAKGEYLNEKGQVTSNSSSADYCDVISFVGGDNIKGPMHTNDAFVICEKPTLGRNAEDPIEVSYPTSPGWFSTVNVPHSGSTCSGSNSNFKGTYEVNSAKLQPPPTNSQLESVAESKFHYTGEVKICLEGSTMKVGPGRTCTGSLYSGPLPANGVIYDSNGSGCTGEYTPINLTYSPTASTCGNVNVEGTYAKPLTIGSANDVVIMNNVTKANSEAMLGLIANNFIRVYHPVELVHPTECTKEKVGKNTVEHCQENTSITECKGNATGSVSNLKIEAALLAINHSFIVDNYKCGAQLGTLNVKGAIAQKYRGAVGTTGNTGYLKNYEYEDEFRTKEPPEFTAPVESDWVIGREIVE
jgi:type II secretory pathway pseudopilin PulG